MDKVNKGAPLKNLPASHFRKTVLFHMEEALRAAEGLGNRNAVQGHRQLRDGLKYFLHNVKVRFRK